MKTTLNKIRVHSPCHAGWEKLLRNLGKTKADDEPLAITIILESNGLDDALWCLRAVDGCQREMRLYAVDCARSVQHLMTDPRSIAAIDVAERYAEGLATNAELAAARASAWDAARATASVAAWDAALATASVAAKEAANTAAKATKATAWTDASAAQAILLCLMCAEIEQREVACA